MTIFLSYLSCHIVNICLSVDRNMKVAVFLGNIKYWKFKFHAFKSKKWILKQMNKEAKSI